MSILFVGAVVCIAALKLTFLMGYGLKNFLGPSPVAKDN